jgi:chromate transporter
VAEEAPLGGVTAQTGNAVREHQRIGLPAIFAAFFWLGVTSFGGNTAAWLYNRIVQRRRWIKESEFLSDMALGRIMPGSGGVNLTAQVGQRLHGGAGGAAALCGLLSGPLVIVVALAVAYSRIGQSAVVHGILDGVAAAAIGLTFATGVKLLPGGPARVGPLGVTLATVLCVGILRWPMLPVVLCLAPVSICLALAQPRAGR